MKMTTRTAIHQAQVAAAAHKHVKHTEDPAQSCTTYQNLIFEDGTARTEPIVICDINEQTPVQDIHADCYSGTALGLCVILAFVLGMIVGAYIGATGVRRVY